MKKSKILGLIIFIIVIIIALLGAVLITNKNKEEKIQELSTNNYLLKYDNTWKVKEQKDEEIKLFHKKTKSELNIIIKELEDEINYKTIDELFDSILYNIQEQNKEYKLLYKEKVKITQNNLEGYKLLFENNERQVEICLYKQSNKLVTITYETTSEYFDILLDSANYIINNFMLYEQKFDVLTSINLETEQITYKDAPEVKSLLNEVKQGEIANENYMVNYSIPSNFKETGGANATDKTADYVFENLELGKSIHLSTNILSSNIYEYLDKEENVNIYNYYSANASSTQLEKFSDEPLCYIFKSDDNIELVFEVNQSHIFRVVIRSMGVGIPKELVEMVKINKIENYATDS